MTPQAITATAGTASHIETGFRRIALRTQHATKDWALLCADLDIALNALAALDAGGNVISLHPAHNRDVLVSAVRRAALAAIDSPDAKVRDLPTLVRLLSLICGCHDPAWLRLGDAHRPADLIQSDIGFLALYRQTLRCERAAK